MIGGYQILDLRGLNLQISASASSITDPFVLKQLSMLNAYIDKAYNFNKPLVNQLKPVLIRFRDKKSGEKTEGATFGEMSVVGNYYTFKITGRISGQFTLIINVAFHEVTNAYGNKEWLINTATIQLADASDVLEGDIVINGDLSVEGLSASGDASVGGNLTVTGSINGEANPSVKPLYFHGIELSMASPIENYIQCHILNNTNTPFDSVQDIIDWADGINADVNIQCNGFIKISDTSYPVIAIRKVRNYGYFALCNNNGVLLSQSIDLADYFTICNDAVNKIN